VFAATTIAGIAGAEIRFELMTAVIVLGLCLALLHAVAGRHAVPAVRLAYDIDQTSITTSGSSPGATRPFATEKLRIWRSSP
jgi:hypothetical protein